MIIVRDSVVALDIELWDLWGKLLERSDSAIEYLHGGYAGIFPAVEAALEGKAAGDRIELRLEPEDAFGEYDENLVRLESRRDFPPEIELGMQFEGLAGDDPAEEGEPARVYTVTDMAEESIVLDGNHPFAGIAVNFIGTVRGVRPATADELERGSADDPSGGILKILH